MKRGFVAQERAAQARFRHFDPELRPNAKVAGAYREGTYDFVLPGEDARLNLFPGSRDEALAVFRQLGISWHDGEDAEPSRHMLSSQVACVNFLFPLSHHPEALIALFRPWFPEIRRPLPMEPIHPDRMVAFEWIGEQNYLKEMVGRGGRTRGAHFTSADAAVLFECADSSRLLLLIEWKYTEKYSSASLATSERGTDRLEIYRHLWDGPRFVVRRDCVPGFEALFYEPIYQLFRQQSLAREMAHARELGADYVRVVHVSPRKNQALGRVTSPALSGSNAPDVFTLWKGLLTAPGNFLALKTDELFQGLGTKLPEGLLDWWTYLTARYRGILSQE